MQAIEKAKIQDAAALFGSMDGATKYKKVMLLQEFSSQSLT